MNRTPMLPSTPAFPACGPRTFACDRFMVFPPFPAQQKTYRSPEATLGGGRPAGLLPRIKFLWGGDPANPAPVYFAPTRNEIRHPEASMDETVSTTPRAWGTSPTAKEKTAVQRSVTALLDALAPERVLKRGDQVRGSIEQHRTPNGCLLQ